VEGYDEVGNACRLASQSRIVASLWVLMTKHHALILAFKVSFRMHYVINF